MKKFIFTAVILAVAGAFSVASLQAQCTGGCSGNKKEETKKEEPKKS